MINKFELMLYVNDVHKISDFLITTLNGKILDKVALPDDSYTIRIQLLDQVSVNLFNVDFITKYSPQVSIEFPSIMLMTDDIQKMHDHISKYTHTISGISQQGGQSTFNFADPEGNYYAVGTLEQDH